MRFDRIHELEVIFFSVLQRFISRPVLPRRAARHFAAQAPCVRRKRAEASSQLCVLHERLAGESVWRVVGCVGYLMGQQVLVCFRLG